MPTSWRRCPHAAPWRLPGSGLGPRGGPSPPAAPEAHATASVRPAPALASSSAALTPRSPRTCSA
eukprot:8749170-Alexandrium_andersonii.AAC.1